MKLQAGMIFAVDIARLIAFYRDALGLVLRSSSPTYAVLDAGDASLALHAIPPHIAADIEIASPPVAREDTALKLIFTTDDIAAAHARLEDWGAELRAPASDGSFDAIDPEGNVFRVTQA